MTTVRTSRTTVTTAQHLLTTVRKVSQNRWASPATVNRGALTAEPRATRHNAVTLLMSVTTATTTTTTTTTRRKATVVAACCLLLSHIAFRACLGELFRSLALGRRWLGLGQSVPTCLLPLQGAS